MFEHCEFTYLDWNCSNESESCLSGKYLYFNFKVPFWNKSFCNSHIKCLFLSYFKLLFTVYICAVCLMVFLLSVCSLFHLKVKSEQKSTHFLKTWVSITKTLEMRRSLNNSEKAPTFLLPKQLKSHNQKRKRTNFNLNFSLYFCFPL